jgi:hypothetical protein
MVSLSSFGCRFKHCGCCAFVNFVAAFTACVHLSYCKAFAAATLVCHHCILARPFLSRALNKIGHQGGLVKSEELAVAKYQQQINIYKTAFAQSHKDRQIRSITESKKFYFRFSK